MRASTGRTPAAYMAGQPWDPSRDGGSNSVPRGGGAGGSAPGDRERGGVGATPVWSGVGLFSSQQQFPVRMASSAETFSNSVHSVGSSHDSLNGPGGGYGGEWRRPVHDEEIMSQEVERGLGLLAGHFEQERKEATHRGAKIVQWRENLRGGTWGNDDESMLQHCAVALEEAAGFASTLGARRDELLGEIDSVLRARKEHTALIAAARTPHPNNP